MRSMRPGFQRSLAVLLRIAAKLSEIESLASQTSSATLQLRYAQNDIRRNPAAQSRISLPRDDRKKRVRFSAMILFMR